MSLLRLAAAVSCVLFLLATACRDTRVGSMESEIEAMRSQVQDLQAQLAEQANQQQRSEAQMVEWLDATSRQLDRFLDKIGAPPIEASAPSEPAVPIDAAPDGTTPRAPDPVATTEVAVEAGATPDVARPASVGPTALLVTLALLAACAGIGFAALRTLRKDADPAAEPAAAAAVDDGHTKLLASLTEWEQQQVPAGAPAVPDAAVTAERRAEESLPIAAVHPETDDLETPAHHEGPAVVEPESASPPHDEPSAELAAPAAEAPAARVPAEEGAPLPAEPAPEPVQAAAVRPAEPAAPEEPVAPAAAPARSEAPDEVVPQPVRRIQVVEHEVPGRIAVDATGPQRVAAPEPIRLPGPPRARFRAMTSSPEDAAVALAAILQIDPRVMRRPAPTVSTTPTTVVAEYSLVPALPPGERGDLEARLWQAVGEARKHGSQPLPSL